MNQQIMSARARSVLEKHYACITHIYKLPHIYINRRQAANTQLSVTMHNTEVRTKSI